MNNYKATPEQWQASGRRAANGNITDIRLLELRARVEALEAQANHSPGATKMVPLNADLAMHGRGCYLSQILRALEALGDD